MRGFHSCYHRQLQKTNAPNPRVNDFAPHLHKPDPTSALSSGALDITSAEDLELFYLAALLLRSQGRVEEVLASGEFGLHRCELIWAALATHIQQAGYELLPGKRYMPGWTNCDCLPEGVAYMEYFKEHPETQCLSFRSARAIHATHHTSGRQVQVVLKIVCTRPGILGDEELEVLQYLSSPDLRRCAANAAVDLLDVVDFPTRRLENALDLALAGDFRIVVMPALDRVVISDCYIMAYALDLMRQAFKAVAFLHSRGICHRDIARRNLMVSGTSVGPPFLLRIIDFGQSFRLKFNDSDPRCPWVGGQIDVEPESDSATLHNPFKAEISALGRTWQFFLSKWPERVQTLLDRMTDSDDPDKRPSATEALYELDCVMAKMGWEEKIRPVCGMKYLTPERLRDAQLRFLMSRIVRQKRTCVGRK